MQLSNAPSQLVLPFANSGLKRTVPIPSQVGTTPGAASYTDGFPPLTMTAVASGGVPPSGLDMNGVLNEMSASDVWACAGAGYQWNSAYAAAIGGYPMGAQVLNAAGSGYWQSLIDNNLNNPDTGGAGWIPATLRATASVYASAGQSYIAGTTGIILDSVEFDSQGLWSAGGQHYVAKWAGVYRVSGSLYMPAAVPQNYAVGIFKNGSLVKWTSGFPQTTDQDLRFSFLAMVNCAIGDYLLAALYASTSGGTMGGGAPNTFVQLEYMGS